jgi:4-hydroxy-3-methylbut-2-enyl diphosphate reductase
VENAIEISYKALEENPGKNVFLLSQMIHNQEVNQDLQDRGIRFIMETDGSQLVDWPEIKPEDIVIIPAFGTTLEIEEILQSIGVEVQQYNTTCPFVEKVWKRAAKLGEDQYTVIIHGKHRHEETRATFSHSQKGAPSVVIRDMQEAITLGKIITGEIPAEDFKEIFKGRYSSGFNPERHLDRVGVVNQTTMLATETQAIADYFKQIMLKKYGDAELKDHFADTRDTLCYATNDNQEATYNLLKENADLAIVVGGYNSSNTSHLTELLEEKYPTYFINSPKEIISSEEIHHWDYKAKEKCKSTNYLPGKEPLNIILTSGASCPDTMVDAVMLKLLEFFPEAMPIETALESFENAQGAEG